MGHASDIITVDVYGGNKNLVCESLPSLEIYVEEVILKELVTNFETKDIKIDQTTIEKIQPN